MRLSPSEQIDASRAALAVGVESRPRFRAALCATLAKSQAERALLLAAFEAYFTAPRGGAAGRQRGAGGAAGGEGRGKGRPTQGGQRSRVAPPERDRPSIRPGRPGRPSVTPERLREQQGEGRPTDRGRSRLRRVVVARAREGEGRGGLEDRERPRVRPPEGGADPRRRDLVLPATAAEEALLAERVASLIHEIRLRRGRRFARGPRGRLWVKKMVRESLVHGGVPFVLPMKERRPRRPRVLVLVDVSHSVARAAGLFLMICRGLRERLGRVSIHLFVDRVVDATEALRRWGSTRRAPAPVAVPARRPEPGSGLRLHSGAPSFADLVRSLPGLDPAAPSDYGRAFYQARTVLLHSGGRDTVLVVLGDARTNQRDPLPWAFEEIASRCRRVLWLNPEPRARWNTGDSVMGAYLPACDAACEVRDLDGLAVGVREILRSL